MKEHTMEDVCCWYGSCRVKMITGGERVRESRAGRGNAKVAVKGEVIEKRSTRSV